jgi:ribosomal protein S1
VTTAAPGAHAPVNEALAFLTFVSAHPVAAFVEGTVTRFTSHGAMITVIVEGQTPVLCYAPTKLLGAPPPKSAREVLTTGESYTFTVVSLDVKRRVAEVTLAN